MWFDLGGDASLVVGVITVRVITRMQTPIEKMLLYTLLVMKFLSTSGI